MASGNINVSGVSADTFALSEATQQAMAAQAAHLREMEIAKRARSVVVPTNDNLVRKRLRELGEPITLFGERVSQHTGTCVLHPLSKLLQLFPLLFFLFSFSAACLPAHSRSQLLRQILSCDSFFSFLVIFTDARERGNTVHSQRSQNWSRTYQHTALAIWPTPRGAGRLVGAAGRGLSRGFFLGGEAHTR